MQDPNPIGHPKTCASTSPPTVSLSILAWRIAALNRSLVASSGTYTSLSSRRASSSRQLCSSVCHITHRLESTSDESEDLDVKGLQEATDHRPPPAHPGRSFPRTRAFEGLPTVGGQPLDASGQVRMTGSGSMDGWSALEIIEPGCPC